MAIDRQRLFDDNIVWAEAIARNVARKVPPSISVDDLKQEALIELWKRAESYDPDNPDGVPFRGYAYIPVRGAVLMACRRRAYTEAKMDELDNGIADIAPHPESVCISGESELERENLRNRVRALIASFKPQQYAEAYLVRRIYLDEAQPADLARMHGKTEKEIKMLAYKGLRRLVAAERHAI